MMVVVLSAGLSGCGTVTDRKSERVAVAPIKRPQELATAAMTREELEDEVMRFADRFSTRLDVVTDRIAEQSESGLLRSQALTVKVASYAAAVDIAVGPNPVANILDMLVLASLTRLTVEDYWVPEVFGQESGQDLLLAVRVLEQDIWAISGKVLTEQQQEDLRSLISTWHEQHPNQYYIWGARFSEFSGQSAALDRVAETGGLLGQVERTRETVDEVRSLGERVLYYLQRAPGLTGFQAELTVYSILRQPEIVQALEDWQRISESMERFAEEANDLPKQRLEAVEQLMQGLTQQRKAFMDDLIAEEDRLRGVLGDLHTTLVAANELVGGLDSLATKFDIGGADEEPFDVNEYRKIVTEASGTVAELTSLVQAVEQLMASPTWEQRVPQAVDVAHTIGDDPCVPAGRGAYRFLLRLAVGLPVCVDSPDPRAFCIHQPETKRHNLTPWRCYGSTVSEYLPKSATGPASLARRAREPNHSGGLPNERYLTPQRATRRQNCCRQYRTVRTADKENLTAVLLSWPFIGWSHKKIKFLGFSCRTKYWDFALY
jgi:hypothetical protein